MPPRELLDVRAGACQEMSKSRENTHYALMQRCSRPAADESNLNRCSDCLSFWVSRGRSLKPRLIHLYTSEQTIGQQMPVLRDFVHPMGRETRQGAIGLALDDDYLEIGFPPEETPTPRYWWQLT